MRRKFAFLLSLLFLAAAAGCQNTGGGSSLSAGSENSTPTKAAYQKITPEEAKQRMDEGGVTIVDVRREEEYVQSHIPDAVLVPNETIGDEPPELLSDKDAVLLVYCRSGVRSKAASEKLLDLGYQNVIDIGGIIDWPYETVSEEE